MGHEGWSRLIEEETLFVSQPISHSQATQIVSDIQDPMTLSHILKLESVCFLRMHRQDQHQGSWEVGRGIGVAPDSLVL